MILAAAERPRRQVTPDEASYALARLAQYRIPADPRTCLFLELRSRETSLPDRPGRQETTEKSGP